MANTDAWNLGADIAEKGITARRERKQTLEDEDRKNRWTDLHDQLSTIRDNAAKLGKLNDPQTLAALATVHQQMDELYHPLRAPGALQRDWEFIKSKITRQPPQAQITTTLQPGLPDKIIQFPVSATALPGSSYQVSGPTGETVSSTTPDITLPAQDQSAIVSAPATRLVTYTPRTPYERKLQAERTQAQQEAQQSVAAGPLTPQQQAQIDAQEQQYKIDAGMQAFDRYRPNATKAERDLYLGDLITSVSGIKTPSAIGKWTTRTGMLNGQKASLMYNEKDGRWSYMSGEPVPAELLVGWVPDLAKPTRQTKSGLVPTKQSPTGWAELWVDPSAPKDQSKWSWTPVAAPRYGQDIQSIITSTDPFGVITTSKRLTGPANQQTMDLSGINQMPEGSTGDTEPGVAPAPATPATAPAAAAPSAAPATNPKQLMRQVPAQPVVTNPHAPLGTYDNPLPLDSTGQVPASAGLNPFLKANVDRLLAGANIDQIGLPAKDRAAVIDAAQKYGWSPQGLFTPKEKLLLREADTYLRDFQKAKSLDVLSSYISRQKINNAIKAADGHGGFLNDQLVMTFGLSPEELDFVQRYLQVRGTVSGLSQLTRGGRTTEAGIKRLQSELPNPLFTHNANDARMQLDRLRSEVRVAQQQGFIGETAAEDTGDTTSNAVDALDRVVSKLPASSPPPSPKAAPSLKPGDTVWRTNADGSQTQLRYKGGKKSDINNYEEVTHAPASQ